MCVDVISSVHSCWQFISQRHNLHRKQYKYRAFLPNKGIRVQINSSTSSQEQDSEILILTVRPIHVGLISSNVDNQVATDNRSVMNKVCTFTTIFVFFYEITRTLTVKCSRVICLVHESEIGTLTVECFRVICLVHESAMGTFCL